LQNHVLQYDSNRDLVFQFCSKPILDQNFSDENLIDICKRNFSSKFLGNKCGNGMTCFVWNS